MKQADFNPDIDLIDFQPAKFLAFRDMEVCKRVARIKKADLCTLPAGTHRQFKARIAPVKDFHFQMALDMLVRIKKAMEEGRQFVGVFPTGPIFQYQMLADLVNALRIPLHHVHYFSMDEYADEDGRDINPEWPGSFHYTIEKRFLSRLDPKLRIPARQVHFPSSKTIEHYDEMIAEARRAPGGPTLSTAAPGCPATTPSGTPTWRRSTAWTSRPGRRPPRASSPSTPSPRSRWPSPT
jgi:hypothetical protein